MKRLWLVWVFVSMVGLFSQVQAALLVSPVIVDAVDCVLGDRFPIRITNTGETSQAVDLVWGWFDQKSDGSVVLDQSSQASRMAKQWVIGSQSSVTILPGATEVVWVTIVNQDFTAIYPVLYIRISQGAMRSNLAVLFLLATKTPTRTVHVGAAKWHESQVLLEVSNTDSIHQGFGGLVRYLDHLDQVLLVEEIPQRRILPGKTRQLVVDICAKTSTLEISSPDIYPGQVRFSR